MAKYRKRPLVVDAVQFVGEPMPGVTDALDSPDCDKRCPVLGFHVHTLEGPLHVTPGDFIITGVKGERYPCKPDVFEATYELVEA